MSDYIQDIVDCKDFKRGKIDISEKQKHGRKSSKKPWLIQSRFVGNLSGNVSDCILKSYHKDWKTEKRFRKEMDAKHCLSDSEKPQKFSLMKSFRSGPWEYRIINETQL